MQIKVNFSKRDGRLSVPKNYNHYLQAMIYNTIQNYEMKTMIHDQGYKSEKRVYRGFCFSGLQGKFYVDSKYLVFDNQVCLYISSYFTDFIQEVAQSFLEADSVMIGNQKLYVEGVEILKKPDFKTVETVKVLSPFTLYSTLEDIEKQIKTRYFYAPDHLHFAEQLRQNLVRKAMAVANKDLSDRELQIVLAEKVLPKQRRVIKYKNTNYVAWYTQLKLIGDPELKEIAYTTGLGSKNAVGFGFTQFVLQ